MSKYTIGFFLLLFSGQSQARLATDIPAAPPATFPQVAQFDGVTVNTDDSTQCLPQELRGFVNELRNRFGSVEINSAMRDRSHNRQVGGARRSQHLNCNAIDFSVPGVSKRDVRLFLIANFSGRGGIGFYCNDRFHLDVGAPRQWGGCEPSRRETSEAERTYSSTQLAVYRQPRQDYLRTASVYNDRQPALYPLATTTAATTVQ